MSESTVDAFELQKAMNEIGQVTTEALTALKEKSEERFTVLAEKSADAIQKYNDLKSKMDADEKWKEDIEKRLVRPVGPNVSSNDEIEMAYVKAVDMSLRNRYPGQSKVEIVVGDEVTHKYLDHYIAKNYAHIDASMHPRIKKDMVEGIDPQGGYWIIPERSSQTITRTFETTPMRMLASIATTSVNDLQMIIDDQQAGSGGWVGETESRPLTTTPQIGLQDFPIYETYANVRATQRIIDDVSFDLQNWLVGKTTDRMTRVENTAFITADGVKKPTGILNYGAWTGSSVVIGDDDNYERDALEYIISGIDGEPTYNGLVNTQSALLQTYQGRGTWLMHRTTWALVLQLVSTTDFPLIDPQSMLREGAPMILLGRPVVFGSDVPQAATDSKSIIYGDFKTGYTIVDRIGFRTIRDNVTQKGYVLYYTTTRVGGALSSFQSLKVNIFSATTGPVTAGVPLLSVQESKAEKVLRQRKALERLDTEVRKIKEHRKEKKEKKEGK